MSARNFLRNGFVRYPAVIRGAYRGRSMHRHITPRALRRSSWFKDLTAALAEAEKLLALLEADGGFRDETESLRSRVQTVQAEIAMLNRVMIGEGRVVGPAWPDAPAGGR